MLNFAHSEPRKFAEGIGRAVADRTVARMKETPLETMEFTTVELPRDDTMALDDQIKVYAKNEGLGIDGYHVDKGDDLTVRVTLYVKSRLQREEWADVAERVSLGNCSLHPSDFSEQFMSMRSHMRNATILMSGRHLQHGDAEQKNRPQEVFTNCLGQNEMILTLEHGAIEIGKIAGETVTVIAGDGQLRQSVIKEHGEQDLQRISFRAVKGGGGKFRKEVVATPNHRWVLRDGSITTSLKVGDVLMSNPDTGFAQDAEAVVHGLIFGDGTAHKRRHDATRPGTSQGRTYASIRVASKDAVRDDIHDILDAAGYPYTTPPHAKGDRVYYIGKKPHFKDVPFTNDPAYISGFIRGWWLADGSKAQFDSTEISTSDAIAAQWLEDHAALAGYAVTMHRVMERREGDGSYANGKPLHFMRLRKGVEWKVDDIEYEGRGPVFCPEEPVTRAFVLANGLLTGNCSTAPATFLSFYLLLNGSGVGRDYSDDIMAVDYANMPIVIPAISWSHPDSNSHAKGYMTIEEAKHLYADRKITVFEVPDSREGWAEAFAQIETMAFEKRREEVLILDFSGVRENGAPIGGMQGRPASGPGPMMSAIINIAKLRDAGMPAWRSALYADHYCAAVVLVGGARRAARMSTKFWRDPGVIDFIRVKAGGQFLWSSNNSVTVDAEFWQLVDSAIAQGKGHLTGDMKWALEVFEAVTDAAYNDGTGEPGFINVDTFDAKLDAPVDLDNIINPDRLKISKGATALIREVSRMGVTSEYPMITNPCGEIQLVKWGGYCVIADVVPFHAASDEEAEDAFRTATRALIRTNLMDCLYANEVKRTNRIGVGFTGLHEYALARFKYGWKDIVNEEKSKDFWQMMARFSRAVKDEAKTYATKLGVQIPHTDTTVKPAGTTSKLFGLTEGAHLPAMLEYLRWVQFRNDDPLVADYEAKGYPLKKLRSYDGTTVVGFPTVPTIVEVAKYMNLSHKLVTAAEATPEEQFEYLRLLEKYWIKGDLEEDTGNQVSFTLKYDPKVVSFEDFKQTILKNQSTVKCVSVMPQVDTTAYEYQPEQPVSKAEFERIAAAIQSTAVEESIDFEHLACEGGACPVDFSKSGI